MIRLTTYLLLVSLFAGCSSFEDEEVVDISTRGSVVSVRNVSEETISYVAIERDLSYRVDLTDPSMWPKFGPDEGYHGPAVGFAMGFEPGDVEFLFLWNTGEGLNEVSVRLWPVQAD
ncbi:MAG: hypothetical protein SH809_07000 [Rhodothermales bacterium]|nr:hypothetical protein [Rhodothermales bacterium]